jgi:hypothetical protein
MNSKKQKQLQIMVANNVGKSCYYSSLSTVWCKNTEQRLPNLLSAQHVLYNLAKQYRLDNLLNSYSLTINITNTWNQTCFQTHKISLHYYSTTVYGPECNRIQLPTTWSCRTVYNTTHNSLLI